MAPSDLSQFITTEQWEAAIAAVQGRPALAQQFSCRNGFFEGVKDSNVLPIHEARVGNAPPEVVQALLQAYPQ